MFKSRVTSNWFNSIFLLCVAALGTILISTQAHAVPPGMELIFKGGPKPVIFSGKIHADAGLKCMDCHASLFKMKAVEPGITFMDHMAGKKYCYACHNGTKAFAPKGNCSKCHGNESPTPGAKQIVVKPAEAPAPAAPGEAKPEASTAPASATAASKVAAAPKKPTGKACDDCPDETGWSGWGQGGIDHLSNDSYHFGRYTGLEESGTHLDGGGDLRYWGKEGGYFEGKASNLGLTSRNISLNGGTQGKYELGLDYDQIPNYRAQDASSPFINNGGGQLGLPSGWVPGATTGTMPNLGSSLRGTPLKTERDRYGVKFSLFPAREWEISGYAHEDKKDGTRDVGATFGFASASILPVPFTYKTDNFGLSLGYRGKRLQYNIAYTGSLFTSDEHSITWSNPYSTPAGVGSGLMAEAPDNQFHKISGRLGYQLTERTRIGGELAYGRMTQNEGFLPYTSNAAISVPALPASSLDAVVDTTLAKLDVNSRPTPRLRINASYTYSNRDNKTPVNNYNYVITDSSLAIDPNTGQPVVRQNRPYGFKQQLLRTNVGYMLPKHMDVSGGFDYDQMNRTYVLVKDTTDKTLWAKLKARPSEKFEGSLKYSYSKRDASSPIVSSATAAYQNPVYPESGVGIASMNPLMLAFNLADRTRNKLGVELALTPKDNLSADLSLDYYKDDYSNMALGLNQAKGLTITPTLTYMFSDKLSGAAYYTYEKLSSDQTSNQWIATPYLSTIWMESDSNVTQTFGLNMNWKAIPDKLDLGADAAYSTFTGKIGYSSGADLPNLDSTLTALGLHGNYKLKDHLSLRGGLWYEKYKESDWAKYPSVNLLPTLLSLGTAPQDLDTYLLSIMLRYDMK